MPFNDPDLTRLPSFTEHSRRRDAESIAGRNAIGSNCACIHGPFRTLRLHVHTRLRGVAAAGEYASGDFDPVPQVGGSEGVFFESNPAAVQVVDSCTVVNGSPAGPPRILGGNNALKISGDDAPSCCQHYQIIPGSASGSGATEATLTFSFYGVPSDDGDDDQRLVEVWANEGGNLGVTGGPGFVFEFRFDENGSVFYDSAGGWDDAGITVPLHQWNTITISSRVDGVNRPLVTLNINGVLHDNGGVGFGDSSETARTIDRFQFSSSNSTGSGSGSFFDDISLSLVLPPINAIPYAQESRNPLRRTASWSINSVLRVGDALPRLPIAVMVCR